VAIQTATTGNLENAQRIILAQSRYTEEHNAPCAELIEHFTLAQGAKTMTVPKVGQATAANLTDGVDLIDSQDIGMTTTDLTTGEVGLKYILTDKLLRQENEDVFKMIGRQGGDAFARKKNRDIIALFSALNGGTTLGVDNASLTLSMATGVVAYATSHKFPKPVYVVHHPNAIAMLSQSAMSLSGAGGVAVDTYFTGILGGLSEELLRNFWGIKINGVNFFQTGDIDKNAGYDSGYGAIFSKNAMCIITSKSLETERERDASLRAWEVVTVADYGVFELDDTYGAPMLYEIGDLSTTTT
jgi:hypothetical protein